jgi:hypothetical protein
MYQITATFGQYSSALVCTKTLAQACDEQATMYAYYRPLHDNTKVFIEQYCDTCTDGRVKKCPCPKKHGLGYHEDRCYKVCPTCKGQYVHPVEA